MKDKIFGDWLGLSFGVFLLVAAIVAIPTGEFMGGLLIRWGNRAPRTEVSAQQQKLAEALDVASDAPPSTDLTENRAPAPNASPATPPASEAGSSAPRKPAILKPAVAAPAKTPALQPARLDVSANASAISPAGAQIPTASSVSGTWLQVAAVAREDSARTLAQALMKKGYPASVKEPQRDALYRVQVGPYPDRQEAQTAAQALKADGFQVIVIG